MDLDLTAHLLQRPDYREQMKSHKFLVGVNTRDLRTLHVDPNRLQKFGPLLPQESTAVAESGLHTPDDAASVVGWGYRMALVGTALMRADDPSQLIADMLAAGRAA